MVTFGELITDADVRQLWDIAARKRANDQ